MKNEIVRGVRWINCYIVGQGSILVKATPKGYPTLKQVVRYPITFLFISLLVTSLSFAQEEGSELDYSPLNDYLTESTKKGQKIDINALIATLSQGKDTEERIWAAKRLGLSKDPKALDPLLKVFRDENRAVRWAAIEALGDLGDKRATPHLLKYLGKKEAYRWGQRLTVSALGAIGDHQAVPTLLDLLKKADNPYFRRLIIISLGKIQDKKAIPHVIEYLNDQSPVVRKYVQSSLEELTRGKIGGEAPQDYDSWKKWYSNYNHSQ